MALVKVSFRLSTSAKPTWCIARFFRGTRNFCTAVHPEIHVNKSQALVYEKVHITISGLKIQQKVTILSSLNERGKIFASCGHYIADGQGRVDLACQSCLGGSFSGIQSMGLFTSAKQLQDNTRLLKKDVTTPFDVMLSAHDDHVECETLAKGFLDSDTEPLAMTSLKRWYLAPGVRKIPILHPEWLKGFLFLPPGEGPFPGIIEVLGYQGVLRHHRAAPLASQGYAVLALDHTLFEDVPNKTKSTQYFLDACDWFSQHPVVQPGGVAIFAMSSGVSVAMWMAMHSDHIKTLVCLNGVPIPLEGFGFKHNGNLVKEIAIDKSKIKQTDSGLEYQSVLDGMDFEEHVIPIWERDLNALFINGEDDLVFHPKWTHRLQDLIPCDKKEHFQFLFYPDAGHLIDPPYSPVCTTQYVHFFKEVHSFGGKTELHLKAQEQAWFEIFAFLKKHLVSRENKNSY